MASSAHYVAPAYEPDAFSVDPAVDRHVARSVELNPSDFAAPQTAASATAGAGTDTSDTQDDITGKPYSSAPGIPGRGVVLISALATVSCAGLNVALTGRLTIFFDLCFVVVALTSAMSALRRDLFTVGVLPPLLFAAVVGAIALTAPETFVATGAISKAFLTGLAAHAVGLVAAYGVALAVVICRVVPDKEATGA
ncbi:MAG: hypothetical protein M3423_01765 [Actinomycetota bacterium]|nr:hypothetical protein [Actinomycetota bacterium]